MNILLTGVTGFLGSHLAAEFLQDGHHVVALKRSTSNTWRIQECLNELELHNVDMEDLATIFAKHQHIHAVVHTATCYGRHGESAEKVLKTNLMFSVKVLDVAAFYNTDTFYNADTFYNVNTYLSKYKTKYSISKRQFSEWGKFYAEEGKINFVNLKIEHVYGDKDSTDKFIPFVIDQCKKKSGKLELTLGEQKRDFIFIDDVSNAYRYIIKEKWSGYQTIGIGTGKTTTIRELVETVNVMLRSNTKLHFGAVAYRIDEIMESHADNSILKRLGWQPRISLKMGLAKILNSNSNIL